MSEVVTIVSAGYLTQLLDFIAGSSSLRKHCAGDFDSKQAVALLNQSLGKW